MYTHSPPNYQCPICLAIQGVESEDTMIKQDDIFYKDNLVMGIINSKFIGNNPGHAIIVPLKHYENIYELPELESSRIIKIAKEVAVAMKEIRKCDGIGFFPFSHLPEPQSVITKIDLDYYHRSLSEIQPIR